MNLITLQAFTEELEEILGIEKEAAGMVRDLGTGVANTLKAFTSPTRASQAFKSGVSLSFENSGSPLAKAGVYSMNIVPVAMQAPEAIKKEDPTGMGRSRLERVTTLGADTVGGFIGAGAYGKGKHMFLGPSLSGMVGSMVAREGARSTFKGGRYAKKKLQRTRPTDTPMGTQPGELEPSQAPITGERQNVLG